MSTLRMPESRHKSMSKCCGVSLERSATSTTATVHIRGIHQASQKKPLYLRHEHCSPWNPSHRSITDVWTTSSVESVMMTAQDTTPTVSSRVRPIGNRGSALWTYTAWGPSEQYAYGLYPGRTYTEQRADDLSCEEQLLHDDLLSGDGIVCQMLTEWLTLILHITLNLIVVL